MELKHLRLLRAIADHGTMSAAARVLGYSQPAVTQQIQHLERELATPLVVRAGPGTRLTEAGEILVRHGDSVLATVARARTEVEAISGLRSGRVRIASFRSAAATLLPPALGAMTRKHPGISFTLVETEPARSRELLRDGGCDVALVYDYRTSGTEPPAPGDDVVATHLLDESVHVALPRAHPTAGEGPVHLRALRDARWIAGCPNCRENLVRSCAEVGYTPDIAFETDDYVALQGLAAAGLGVAFVPELMLAVVRSPALALPPLHPNLARAVHAVTTRQLLRVPAVARTIAALRATATAWPASNVHGPHTPTISANSKPSGSR